MSIMYEEANIKDPEYLKRIEQITKKQFRKIYTNKQMGFPQKTIRRRNLATALAVCELVGELDFPKVAQYSLVLTKDPAVKKLATMYESQVELANINPEKFVNGIDSFFNSVAVYIKKNDLYREHFELYRIYKERMIKEKISDKTRYSIYIALSNLISETFEHLKKNKFNLKKTFAVRHPKGNLWKSRIHIGTQTFRTWLENKWL